MVCTLHNSSFTVAGLLSLLHPIRPDLHDTLSVAFLNLKSSTDAEIELIYETSYDRPNLKGQLAQKYGCGIFCRFSNFHKCRPEVAGYVISGVAID